MPAPWSWRRQPPGAEPACLHRRRSRLHGRPCRVCAAAQDGIAVEGAGTDWSADAPARRGDLGSTGERQADRGAEGRDRPGVSASGIGERLRGGVSPARSRWYRSRSGGRWRCGRGFAASGGLWPAEARATVTITAVPVLEGNYRMSGAGFSVTLLDLVTSFEDAPSLRPLLGAIATEPLLDVVIAAGLSWAAHSSAAIVLLVMSLAAKGVVPPDAAPSPWSSAPILAPRSTRYWKVRKGRTPPPVACWPATQARASPRSASSPTACPRTCPWSRGRSTLEAAEHLLGIRLPPARARAALRGRSHAPG